MWLGLASGLIVFVLAITGCIYVFEKELRSIVYREQLYVVHAPASAAPLPLPDLWKTAQAALGDSYPIHNVEIAGDRNRTYAFSAAEYADDAWTFWGEEVYSWHVYVNPYDGHVVKVENTKFEFFNLVFWAHWSLLLSTPIGQPIVGTATLIFIVLLVTGLILWWPRNKAALKARLRVSWRSKWKRLNWDLHSVPGFYVMLLALLIAMTGLVWAFHWFDDAVYFVATGGVHHEEEPSFFSDTTGQRGKNTPLDATLARVHADYPAFRSVYLTLPDTETKPMTAYIRLHPQAKYDYAWLQFDQYSGKLLDRNVFADLNAGQKLRTMNYDLHTGSVLGVPGKILAFLASLVCASLPVTGFLIWWGKRSRKPSPDRRRRAPGIAPDV